MAIQGVPLFMGGDEAEHSAELLRMLVFSAYRGQEGWLTSVAGRCETLAIPGAGVRLLPGPFVVNSRFVGGEMQAYMSGIINDEEVETTTVPSGFPGGVRHDLVVANIEDPFPTNGVQWPLPSSPDAMRLGPYWRVRVIENVPSNCVSVEQIPLDHPSGARTWTAIASARLVRPAGTGTITESMIRRINIVCNPLTGIQLPQEVIDNLEDLISSVQSQVGGLASGKIPIPGSFTMSRDCVHAGDNNYANTLHWSYNNYRAWPREAFSNEVMVPTWATHAECFAIISNPMQKGTSAETDGHIWGDTRIRLMDLSEYVFAYTPPEIFDHDEINSFDNRPPSPNTSTFISHLYRAGNRPQIIHSGVLTVPAFLRGRKCNVQFEARMYNDAATKGQLIADNSTSVRIEINFKEKP